MWPPGGHRNPSNCSETHDNALLLDKPSDSKYFIEELPLNPHPCSCCSRESCYEISAPSHQQIVTNEMVQGN